MAKQLNKAQVNHLRRLLGWVRCEIPPEPGAIVAIVNNIRTKVEVGPYGKQRMVEWHREAENVPKYIRAALKSLASVVKESQGEIVGVESVKGNTVALRIKTKRLPRRLPRTIIE